MDFKPDLRNVKWMKGYRDLPTAYAPIKTPGVTTIISAMIPNPEIDEWIKAVGKVAADKITQYAHWRGTAMHLFIENYLIEMKRSGDPSAALKFTQVETPPALKKEDESIPENQITKGRDLFYNFINSDYSSDYLKSVGTEMMVYSPYLFYRGKIDWTLVKIAGGVGVRDFKSASKLIEPGSRKEEGYKVQLGAYAQGLDDMYRSDGNSIRVNYASIISMHTKSEAVQNIEVKGDELEKYKAKFKEITIEWHRQNGQGFLVEDKPF